MRRTCLIFISCSKTAFCVPSQLAEVLTCVKQKTLFTFGDQQTTQGYVSYIGLSAYFGFVRTFICKIVPPYMLFQRHYRDANRFPHFVGGACPH